MENTRLARTLAEMAERWKAPSSDPKAQQISRHNWLKSGHAQRVLRDVPQADAARCPEGLLDAIRDAHRKRQWPIYLTGPTGTGKSSAAAFCFRRVLESVADEATQDNHWPRFIAWPEFCSRLIAARMGGITIHNEDGQTYAADERSWWRRWSTRRLVVIDEIGLRTANEVRQEAMWQLLETRRGLPTILTGNLDAEALRTTFDDRVLSRLVAGTWIDVIGKDQRVIGAGKRRVRVESTGLFSNADSGA